MARKPIKMPAPKPRPGCWVMPTPVVIPHRPRILITTTGFIFIGVLKILRVILSISPVYLFTEYQSNISLFNQIPSKSETTGSVTSKLAGLVARYGAEKNEMTIITTNTRYWIQSGISQTT
jgi:hypothetical protein